MSFSAKFERQGGHFHRSYKTPIHINSNSKLKMNSQNSRPVYLPAGLSDSEDESNFVFKKPKPKIEDLGVPNLHIRVVPSVFESCTFEGKPFDKKLDEFSLQWFDKLTALWRSWKKSQPVEETLHSFFSSASNPYYYGLKLYVNCSDYNEAKPNRLPYVIIEELNNWSKSYVNELKSSLTKEVQWIAFTLVKLSKISNVVKLFNETFRLYEKSDLFLSTIHQMLLRKEYKEVCQWAICLNLNSNFTYEDFVLPLILQDRQDLAEQYLDHNPQMQGQLVKFLDSLLNRNSTVRNCIEPYIKENAIPEVKYDKLHHKPLSKLIARLCSKYSLETGLCQNFNLKRNEGALNFIIHKRYVEESLNEASWNEMLQETVGQSKEMQRELITLMVRHGDTYGALKWAQYYEVPYEYWPFALKEFSSPTFCEPEEENWDAILCNTKNLNISDATPHSSNVYTSHNKQNHLSNTNDCHHISYHPLNLPEDRIILVDTEYLFEEMLQNGFKDVTRVGLDSEWKPYFGTKQSDVALIQLSTGRYIYLLDVVELGHAHHLWKQLSTQLFENHEILKLGYGLRLDLEKIQTTLKLRNSIFCGGVGWLDLQDLTKALGRNSCFKYPHSGEPGCGDGLSALVQLCLGSNLDKTNQFSNWELRPLRKEQILYAALDAHCLLEVHDVIVEICNNCNINLTEIYDRITQNIRTPKKRNRKRSDKKQSVSLIEQAASPFVNLPQRGVDSIKVVCDSMLEGLSKSLRKCGIDAISIENSKDHDMCINLAQKQQRIILTRGTFYNRLHQFVPLGYCYRVKSDQVEEQLKEVLDYYNVKVTENNIFSRCQICNNNEFLSISRSEMNVLVNINNAFDKNNCGTSEQLHVNNRSWNLVRSNAVSRFTKSGALIQANLIPQTVLNNVSVYYVCQECGKVYWDGTHFGRVIAGRLKNIVKK